MTNLNEMNTKELKAMAKELSVKNWWNLKKTDLINEIAFAIADREDAGEEVDVDNIAESAQAEAEAEETTEETAREVKKPSLGINEIEFNGKTQSLRAWATELEMPWPTLYDRINRNGWTIEEALTIPLGSRRKKRA